MDIRLLLLLAVLGPVRFAFAVRAEDELTEVDSPVEREQRSSEGQIVGIQRLRAFNETGLRMLMEGADLPLSQPSFIEEDATFDLPKPWNTQLKVVKKLGEGSFGQVFKCQVLCQPDSYVTVKLIAEKSALVQREMKMLQRMSGISDFCISSMGSPSYLETSQGYWVMMPLMNKGELFDLIVQCEKNFLCTRACPEGRRCWKEMGAPYSTQYILTLFHDIVNGVDILYKKTGFLHTDLKPQNVMVSCESQKCFAAVIDLGLVCDPKDPNDCKWQGTPTYIPPEVYLMRQKGYGRTPARDVWALGVILYQLMYKNLPPFYADSKGTKLVAYRPDADRNIPNNKRVDKLVKEMLNPDFTKRPTLSSILRSLEDIVLKDYPKDHEAEFNLVLDAVDRGAKRSDPACLTKEDEPPLYKPSGDVGHVKPVRPVEPVVEPIKEEAPEVNVQPHAPKADVQPNGFKRPDKCETEVRKSHDVFCVQPSNGLKCCSCKTRENVMGELFRSWWRAEECV